MKYFTLICCAFFLINCRHSRTFYDNTITYQIKPDQQIGGSNYYLSLPSGYHIEYIQGKDGVSYYFLPFNKKRDSCIAGFMAGCCVGQEGEDLELRKEIKQGQLLDSTVNWSIYDEDTSLYAETYKRFSNYYAVSASIRSKRRTEVDSFINIFATLRIKKE